MPETREEAVRRKFGKWAQEQIPKIADGGGNLPLAWLSWQASREAALREAMSVAEKRRIFNACESDKCTTMFMRMRRQSNCEEATEIMYQIKALIPVAGKKEKA